MTSHASGSVDLPRAGAFSADAVAARSAHHLQLIQTHLNRTPLVDFSVLSAQVGADVQVKCEHLQCTGSFKARGALAKVSTLSADQRAKGVVVASSGNHGLGVANALAVFGGRGIVFVPEHASAVKVAGLRRYGVEVRPHGQDTGLVESFARGYAAEHGMTYVSPYNDAEVIAGQGTVGLEIVDQLDGAALDAIVISVGGGGLISGVAAVLKQHWPEVRIVGASPANDAAMTASVRARRVVQVEATPTLSDGTAGSVEPDAITFDLCRKLVDDWVLVDERAIGSALRLVVDTEHQLIEGAAAVAIAAILDYGRQFHGGRIGVVSCGANISADILARALTMS